MNKLLIVLLMSGLSMAAVYVSDIWLAYVPVLFFFAMVLGKSIKLSIQLGASAIVLWYAVMLCYAYISNDGRMMVKMAAIFNVNNLLLFVLIHLLFAALVGGVCAGAGASVRQILPVKKKSYPSVS